MRGSLLEQLDRTPVTWVVLLAYVTLAFLTGVVEPDGTLLGKYGWAEGILIQNGEPWRLLTYAFLHGGLLHLFFNSYVLYLFGPGLEQRLGSVKFALLYVVAALGGGVAAVLWSGAMQPMVGGSGALFGMFGAALAINMRQGRHYLEFLDYHGPRSIVFLIVANLVIGMIFPMISNAGHVGGLIAGFALTFFFLERGRGGADRQSRAIQAGWITALAGLTFYCVFPVARWDYLLFRWDQAPTIEQRAELRRALMVDPDTAADAEWYVRRVLEKSPNAASDPHYLELQDALRSAAQRGR